jgi:hypothetical protein
MENIQTVLSKLISATTDLQDQNNNLKDEFRVLKDNNNAQLLKEQK